MDKNVIEIVLNDGAVEAANMGKLGMGYEFVDIETGMKLKYIVHVDVHCPIEVNDKGQKCMRLVLDRPYLVDDDVFEHIEYLMGYKIVTRHAQYQEWQVDLSAEELQKAEGNHYGTAPMGEEMASSAKDNMIYMLG